MSAARQVVLSLRGVDVGYGSAKIIRDINAEFGGGKLVALVGPNGAGKTTLLRAVAGLLPFAGEINLDGCSITAMAAPARARAIGYLPQGHAAHWPLAARDIVALGRYPFGAKDPGHLSQTDVRLVDAAMRQTEVSEFSERDVQTLSGGERARVMIARVLASQTPLILADEPTAALDPRHQLMVLELFRQQARNGALVIFVTHDLILASRFADRLVVLAEGLMVVDGRPPDVLTDELVRSVYGVTVRRFDVEGGHIVLPWSPA